MTAYALFSRYLPEPWPSILTALWYAVLMLLVVVFAFEPQAEFRYIGM
ncbi:MAG: hypothetical protein WB812_06890 [Woeseiaceae bacterium]